MKVCNKCNKTKELSEYYWNSFKKKHTIYCKECARKDDKQNYHENIEERRKVKRAYFRKHYKEIYERQKRNRLNLKDGYYYVYCLLDKDFYVGQTDSVKWRNYTHKSEDVMILHKCKTRKEAKWFEKVYHDIGFPGRYGTNKKTPSH